MTTIPLVAWCTDPHPRPLSRSTGRGEKGGEPSRVGTGPRRPLPATAPLRRRCHRCELWARWPFFQASPGSLAFVHQVPQLLEAALDEAGDGRGTATEMGADLGQRQALPVLQDQGFALGFG